ncbi:putative uncharacterized protein C8orf89 homolog isoform X2 [Sceloporus undulatus]|uniref:putative uncharacterized protein C8orf89 homolog isoform X2 n=1 Tax=Sceloporus undulatus TaxID=8520 RepID=UPI001C4CB709|nr:putative uncharacterized protein C8orf89 homolog isoform X2 [Sceloporus undulatus]
MSSRSRQRTRLEPKGSQEHDNKLPEIASLQECKHITSQPLKEQKLPTLTSDHRFLDTKVSGKSFRSCPFQNSWKSPSKKTKTLKQEYPNPYGVRDSGEAVPMPSLSQRSDRYSAIPNPSPDAQKTQGAANSFTNRGERAVGDIKRGGCSWKPSPLKTSEVHGGAGELGATRLKKQNRCTSLISFPEVSRCNSDYCYKDPVRGAPPRYLQRLSELATLEHETIHQEKRRKIRKTKKEL